MLATHLGMLLFLGGNDVGTANPFLPESSLCVCVSSGHRGPKNLNRVKNNEFASWCVQLDYSCQQKAAYITYLGRYRPIFIEERYHEAVLKYRRENDKVYQLYMYTITTFWIAPYSLYIYSRIIN